MSRLALVGAGPIGVAAAAAAVADGVVDGVGAVVDPDDDARSAAVSQFGADGYATVRQLPEADEGDWALVAFSSRAEATAPEILRLVARKYHVVTTCEEMSRPDHHVLQAVRTAAVTDGRRVIATGANPGFVMDRLALAIATASRVVHRVDVSRRVDTSTRRGPLVEKTGRGLTEEEFRSGAAKGRIGHVGLLASAKLLARGLQWPTSDANETIEAVLDDDGVVQGVHQEVTLQTPEGGVLHLDLVMAWQVGDPGDTVHVHGTPEIRMHFPGGYHGDEGTTAQVVNAIGRYNNVPPGFYRSIDLPLRFS